MDGKDASADAARYLAAVWDPALAPEGARVVHGLVSSYPTSAMKSVFTGVVQSNAEGNLQLFLQPGQANDSGMLIVMNQADLTSARNYVSATDGKYEVKASSKIANDMISQVRVVACSLQVTYLGNPDKASGTAMSTFMPVTLENAKTAFTPDQLTDQPFNRISGVQPNKTLEVIWMPRSDKDLDFKDPATGNMNGFPTISIFGGEASGWYRYTIYLHREYIPTMKNYIASVAVPSQVAAVDDVMHNVAKSRPAYSVSEASSRDIGSSIFDMVVDKTFDYGGKIVEKGLESILEAFLAAV
jgi:hypothetical protein